MKIDDLDINILAYLFGNSHCTTTELTKKLYDTKDSREIVKIDSMIRYRVKRLAKMDIITSSNTTPAYYDLNKSCVFFGKGNLKINIENNRFMTVAMGHFMVIRVENDIIVKSMDAYEERIKYKKSIIQKSFLKK